MNRPARTDAAPAARSDTTPHFYRPNGYQPEDSVAYLMRQILIANAGSIEQALEPFALTNAQWMPMLKLHRRKASTAAELARDCHIDAGAMTRMLDRLEDKAFIRRTRSSQDRRVVHIELTPEGQDTARHIPGVICDVQNASLRGFSHAELETLQSLLRRVLANAQEASQ